MNSIIIFNSDWKKLAHNQDFIKIKLIQNQCIETAHIDEVDNNAKTNNLISKM